MKHSIWIFLLLLTGAMALKTRAVYIDYPMYERAAGRVLSGDLANLYEPGITVPPKFHYSYFFAWAFIPFVKIGPALGRWVYFSILALSFFYVFFAGRRMARELGPPLTEKQETLAAWMAALVLSYPVHDVFVTGNIGVILAALMLLSYRLHEKHPVLSGSVLGAAITFKLYPALLVGFYIWARRWRAAFAATAFTFLFYLGLPQVLEGPIPALEMVQAQMHALRHFGEHWAMDSLYFQNIPAAVMRWGELFGVPWQRSYSFSVLLALGFASLLFLPSLFRAKDESEVRTGAILFFALVPLVVPTGWINMGVFYAPLVALCARTALREGEVAARVALATCFVLYNLTTRDIIGGALNDRLEFYSIPVVGILALVVWSVISRRTRPLESTPVSTERYKNSRGELS